jgi:hypothetical protein
MERKITYDYTKQPSLEWYPDEDAMASEILEPLPDYVKEIYHTIVNRNHPFLSKFFPTFVDPMDQAVILDYQWIFFHINIDDKNNIKTLMIQEMLSNILGPNMDTITIYDVLEMDKALDDLASRLEKLINF